MQRTPPPAFLRPSGDPRGRGGWAPSCAGAGPLPTERGGAVGVVSLSFEPPRGVGILPGSSLCFDAH